DLSMALFRLTMSSSARACSGSEADSAADASSVARNLVIASRSDLNLVPRFRSWPGGLGPRWLRQRLPYLGLADDETRPAPKNAGELLSRPGTAGPSPRRGSAMSGQS